MDTSDRVRFVPNSDSHNSPKIRARLRLMKRRWPIRWRAGLFFGVMVASVASLLDWTGTRGVWGLLKPGQPMVDVILRFPNYVVLALVIAALWPWRWWFDARPRGLK